MDMYTQKPSSPKMVDLKIWTHPILRSVKLSIYIYIHKFELNRCLKYEFHANSVSKLGVSTSKWIRCPTRPAGPSGDGSKFEAQRDEHRTENPKENPNKMEVLICFNYQKKHLWMGLSDGKKMTNKSVVPFPSAILLEVMALPVKVCLEVPFHRGKHPRGPWPP